MICSLILAATLLTGGGHGISLEVTSETQTIDPARSVFVTLTVKSPRDVTVTMPDLRERARGFSQTEDFEEEPNTLDDGSVVRKVNWKLVPEPCADQYKIAPFVVTASPRLMSSAADEGSLSFWAGPVKFAKPPPRETVTGGMECDPQKELPPFSWKLVGYCALALLAAAAIIVVIVFGIRYLARRVKEHRMSPIERAWVELDRLLKKGLPGRGRYKDFYVELTMVVRRYIQRKYGIRAPHLTTEEFLKEIVARDSRLMTREGEATNHEPLTTSHVLQEFLVSADMVKFAGVEATPDMADAATESARGYLKGDDKTEAAK